MYARSGYSPEAVRALADLYESKPALRREILQFAANENLSLCMRMHRSACQGRALPAGGGAPGSGGATAEDIETIMSARPRAATWPLAGGRALRDATRAEIMAQIEIHESQARGHSASAQFLAAVVARLTGDGPVHSVLTDDEIQAMHDEVFPS